MPKRKPEDMVQVNLRMPEALRQILVDEAAKADRTMNQEMLTRIMQTFHREEADEQLQEAQALNKHTRWAFEEMAKRMGLADWMVADIVAAPVQRPTKGGKKK